MRACLSLLYADSCLGLLLFEKDVYYLACFCGVVSFIMLICACYAVSVCSLFFVDLVCEFFWECPVPEWMSLVLLIYLLGLSICSLSS